MIIIIIMLIELQANRFDQHAPHGQAAADDFAVITIGFAEEL